MSAASVVDGAVEGRVLVFGSAPPAARDLDLLVPATERARVEQALQAAGYEQRGDAWASFAGGKADVVELSSAADFGIPEEEVQRACAAGVPLDGLAHVVRPAPADDLLILAKLTQWGGWKEKRRARLDRSQHALAEAGQRAALWGVQDELRTLGTARPRPRRPSRPRVVALSGIDGSGKSTQARMLAETLRTLGHDVEVAWTPLSQNAWLGALAAPVKRVLRLLRPAPAPAVASHTGLHRDEGTELRSRSPLVLFAWTMLVAFANGLFHARTAARNAAAGRIVVFDRYLLDTAAQFRFRYGGDRGYRLQNRVVRLLSPAPAAAFFLDIPAETSLARKPDDRWTPDELALQERLYREEAARMRVQRLDALRPQDELAAEIARAVWRAL